MAALRPCPGRRQVLLAVLATLSALSALLVLAGCAAPQTRTAVPRVPIVPTGWNSWNAFGCSVTQARVEAAADAMVSTGLLRAGFRYVVVDDCWVAPTRDSRGRLRADRTRFPGGIAALARYVHARGLRFGLYTSASTKTCAQRTGVWPGATGSEGHEAQDARTFAAWGVDLVKDDWCGGQVPPARQRAIFADFRDGILATGRPMVLAINPNSGVKGVPGADEDWAGVATTVRITHDVVPTWRKGGSTSGSRGVSQEITAAEESVGRDWSPAVRQDADMLVVGHSPLTAAEQRSQLYMLAELGLPLMAGNDLTAMSRGTRALLANWRVVALATDKSGRPVQLGSVAGVHVWARPTRMGRVFAAYNPLTRSVTISLATVVGDSGRDLTSGQFMRTSQIRVGPHDTILLMTR